MNERLKYKVVAAGSAIELEAKVNRELRWGKWRPQGGLCTVEYPNAKDPDLIQTLWTQALVSSQDRIPRQDEDAALAKARGQVEQKEPHMIPVRGYGNRSDDEPSQSDLREANGLTRDGLPSGIPVERITGRDR